MAIANCQSSTALTRTCLERVLGRLPKASKRRDIIRRFRELGWDGPERMGSSHGEGMVKGNRKVHLPNEHREDIGEGLLKTLLTQAGIAHDEWLGG